jgi:hypothetical protein
VQTDATTNEDREIDHLSNHLQILRSGRVWTSGAGQNYGVHTTSLGEVLCRILNRYVEERIRVLHMNVAEHGDVAIKCYAQPGQLGSATLNDRPDGWSERMQLDAPTVKRTSRQTTCARRQEVGKRSGPRRVSAITRKRSLEFRKFLVKCSVFRGH